MPYVYAAIQHVDIRPMILMKVLAERSGGAIDACRLIFLDPWSTSSQIPPTGAIAQASSAKCISPETTETHANCLEEHGPTDSLLPLDSPE